MLEISLNPFPQLTTERLLLRAVDATDAAALFALRSNPAAMQFVDRPRFEKQEEAVELVATMQRNVETNTGITWAIALKEEPAAMIGTIGLWRFIKEHYRAEIGYMLLPAFWKKGYMKEASDAVIKFAFNSMNFHSIEANINPHNLASEALLQKSGFVKEAHFRENYYYNGRFFDSVIYSLVNNS
ncbi:MAG: N-acetyltransferase [Chitinophagaceae bacterium]|nr:MAG: N-acetyltransferase [Chitinophagaceae bacterium]